MYGEINAKCNYCGHWSPEYSECEVCGAPVGEATYVHSAGANAFVPCKFCGQWGAAMTACGFCGAPIDPPDYEDYGHYSEYWMDGGGSGHFGVNPYQDWNSVPPSSPYSDWNTDWPS